MAIQNSDAKIFQAGKSMGRSLGLIGRYAQDIDEGRLYERLMKLGNSLIEAPVTSDLEPVFKIEREIGLKVEKFARAKSETAALSRFQRASDQLLRYAEKMESGPTLVERMKTVSELDLAKVADLQPIFALCDEVFVAVGDFQNSEIERKIDRTLNGWLTAKTGEVGRYAEAFKGTEVYLKALAWKANKPLANADYRAFKTWRDAGYELLKGELDHPWGMCQCGQEKLLPWQDKTLVWRVSKLGRECYNTQKEVSVLGKSMKVKKIDTRTPEEIEADRKSARELNERNRLAKKNRRRQGAEASAGASQQLDCNMEGFRHSIRKHEKELREQGSHPEGKGKKKKAKAE